MEDLLVVTEAACDVIGQNYWRVKLRLYERNLVSKLSFYQNRWNAGMSEIIHVYIVIPFGWLIKFYLLALW